MLTIIIAGLIFVVIAVFPTMFAAKKLGAGKSGLLDAFIALIAGSIAAGLIAPLLPAAQTNEVAAFVYTLAITGVVYKYLLQATYITAVLIALMAWGIQMLIGVILSAIF
ncbi:hypothetical protein [Marinagarivorans cellulosilyticus]|uniref:Uncharacterized protein n=1 Tax=Marinagarivorans cellulosilyticus TaxID=2721545 RepID=A0AAN1WFI2_9GAMM|nr:hypothetical protein [Marinagarivorans cellulosilyticus]BCD96657.1 hypothetical protein MARGE09_P0857 [Marinagarivorans cellulosilyticus]